MGPFAISAIVLACIAAGAALGMTVGQALTRNHLVDEAKDTLKTGMGLIATLSALVLGLLVAATKGNYDAQAASTREMSANLLLLDRLLDRYGPETKDARGLLHRVAADIRDRIGSAAPPPSDGGPSPIRSGMDDFYTRLAGLTPHNDAQRSLKDRALGLTTDLTQTHFRMVAQDEGSIPLPFLAVLVFWLTILFCGYGLLAPRNATVVVSLAICAVSVAGAIFLILELDRPLQGIIRIPDTPLRQAVRLLNR